MGGWSRSRLRGGGANGGMISGGTSARAASALCRGSGAVCSLLKSAALLSLSIVEALHLAGNVNDTSLARQEGRHQENHFGSGCWQPVAAIWESKRFDDRNRPAWGLPRGFFVPAPRPACALRPGTADRRTRRDLPGRCSMVKDRCLVGPRAPCPRATVVDAPSNRCGIRHFGAAAGKGAGHAGRRTVLKDARVRRSRRGGWREGDCGLRHGRHRGQRPHEGCELR